MSIRNINGNYQTVNVSNFTYANSSTTITVSPWEVIVVFINYNGRWLYNTMVTFDFTISNSSHTACYYAKYSGLHSSSGSVLGCDFNYITGAGESDSLRVPTQAVNQSQFTMLLDDQTFHGWVWGWLPVRYNLSFN